MRKGNTQTSQRQAGKILAKLLLNRLNRWDLSIWFQERQSDNRHYLQGQTIAKEIQKKTWLSLAVHPES